MTRQVVTSRFALWYHKCKGDIFVLTLRILYFTVLLAFMACSTPSLPTGENTQKPFETSSDLSGISGKVEGWNRGAQQLVLQSTSSGNAPILSEGNIDSGGQFSLSLPASVADSALNEFTACNGATVTANSKVMFVPFIAVKATSGAFLGAIALTNTDASLIGPFTPQAGLALVAWMYSNQDSTARGSCGTAQEPSSTYDYQLKKGWNSVIAEYTSATNLHFRSGKTSSKLSWRFSPTARKLTLEPQNIKLEIGQSKQYVLAVQEADGTAVAGAKPIWSSTKPNIASVNNDGLVTANSIGQTEIRATLDGLTISSPLSTFGMQAAGGTYSISGQNKKGTAFALRYSSETGQASGTPFNISVTGPDGWNNNQPLAITYPANSNGFGFTSDAQAVSGTYTLTRNGSSTTFTLDAAGSIPVVQKLQVTALYTTALTASFEQSTLPPGSSIKARVFDVTIGQYVGDESPYFYSSGSFSFNATLDDLHQNELHVFSHSFDPNYSSNQPQYHVALLKVPLDFKPQIKSLSHTASPSTGKVRISIYGNHFRNDTQVKFGDVLATSTSIDGRNQITVIVPSHALGTVDVNVSTAIGTSTNSSVTKFKYFQMQKTDLGFVGRSTLAATATGAFWYLPEFRNTIGYVSAAGQVQTFTIPSSYDKRFGGSARPFTVDASGNAWFAVASNPGETTRSLVKVTPDGAFSNIDLPATIQNDVFGLVVGPDQNIWFFTRDSAIYRIQTNGQGFTKFPMPNSELIFTITRGIDNAIWLTVGGSYSYASRIAKVTLNGTINVFAQDTWADVLGLTAGPENKMWFIQARELTNIVSSGTVTRISWIKNTDTNLWPSSLTLMAFDGLNTFWMTASAFTNDTSGLFQIGTDGRLAQWALYSTGLDNPAAFRSDSISNAVFYGGQVHVIQDGQLLRITP
jgi:streptogramin lyase